MEKNKIFVEIKEKIQVRFPYNPKTIQKIKQAPDGRSYAPQKKIWSLPITIDNLNFLIDNFNIDKENEIVDLNQKLENKLNYGFYKNVEKIKEINWNCEPFQHQITGFLILIHNPFAALHWEQGIGKTLSTIKAIEYKLKNSIIKNALIVCPKTVTVSWLSQFQEFAPALKPVIITGTPVKRAKILKENAKIYIINYDLLKAMEKDFLNFDMIVFDESQFLKNGRSLRSKSAYRISRNSKYRVMLTGTPITKSAEDIFSQFKILDESIFGLSFYKFRLKYFENFGYNNIPDWRIKKESNKLIKSKIKLRAERLKKNDVLDLPDKLYQKNYIEMTTEQKRIYKEVEKDLFTVIDGQEIEIHFLITKMMKLNQISSGFIFNEKDQIKINNEKAKEVYRIFQDSGKQKMVVWTIFKFDIKILSEIFKDEKVEIIDGSRSTIQRMTAINNFQNGNSSVILIQEQAGATGITLTASNLVIFYSHSYNLGNRMQAEDRSHRIGQKKNVTYIDLITAGSIENEIIANLERKRKLASYLLGDISEEVFLSLKEKYKLKKIRG